MTADYARNPGCGGSGDGEGERTGRAPAIESGLVSYERFGG